MCYACYGTIFTCIILLHVVTSLPGNRRKTIEDKGGAPLDESQEQKLKSVNNGGKHIAPPICTTERAISYVVLGLKISGTLSSDSSESDSEIEDGPETLYQLEDVPLILHGTLSKRLALDFALAEPGKDVVCSPLAALIPLAKLLIGASGECEEQLEAAVGANSPAEVKARFRPLLKHLKALTDITVAVLTRIYMSNKHERHTLFRNYVKDIFKSSVKMEDLGQPEQVSRKINDWVAKRTKQAFPEFVKSTNIPVQDGSLMIVNTVYLSAGWKHGFTLTDFYANPMMTRGGRYKYFDSEFFNCQVVQIPFTSNKASFTIFLPRVKGDFVTVLNKLKTYPEQIQTSLNRMTKTFVKLTIPRFWTSTDLDLINEYRKLGLTHIFNNTTSGLTGIIKGSQNLFVANAIQRIVIKVNEMGVGTHYEEKSASPSLDMAPLSEIENPKVFTADGPFLYIVSSHKEIIVSGVYNPK